MKEHNRSYKSDTEFLHRFTIFKTNAALVEDLNAKSNGGAFFAMNKFGDLSAVEFREIYLMQNLPPYEPNATFLEVPQIKAPATFNWEDQGACTPVKDQGQCGSCWAFSATENIESVWKLSGKPLPTLSPQQIVDCDKTCYGCGGGWPYLAFQYVVQAGGQDSESAYPYTARDGACNFKPAAVVAKISGYKNVPKNWQTIMNSLPTTSPFSVCVDASTWQFYNSGVMTPDQCGSSVDHCVQMVGYNNAQSPPYWILRNSWGSSWGQRGHIWIQAGTEGDTEFWWVRNSWGKSWGQDGYLQIERNKNLCGIADEVTLAKI